MQYSSYPSNQKIKNILYSLKSLEISNLSQNTDFRKIALVNWHYKN